MGAESVNAGAENYVSREMALGHEQHLPEGLLRVVPGTDATLIESQADSLKVAETAMLRTATIIPFPGPAPRPRIAEESFSSAESRRVAVLVAILESRMPL